MQKYYLGWVVFRILNPSNSNSYYLSVSFRFWLVGFDWFRSPNPPEESIFGARVAVWGGIAEILTPYRYDRSYFRGCFMTVISGYIKELVEVSRR